MSIELACFWLFSPALLHCVREELVLKTKMRHSAKSSETIFRGFIIYFRFKYFVTLRVRDRNGNPAPWGGGFPVETQNPASVRYKSKCDPVKHIREELQWIARPYVRANLVFALI